MYFMEKDKKVTPKEKEEIFIKRTQEKYPAVWQHYTKHISHELMSKEELAEYNFEQRKAIVKYAYENTKFYRDLYDKAGFNPDDLKTEEDWNKVPVINKQMVRENMDGIIVGGPKGELASKYGKQLYTGGSTGRPLPIVRDMRNEQAGSTLWRSRGWWEGRPKGEITGPNPVLGQNEGIIWRMRGVNVKNADEREKEKAIYYPMRKYYLDAQEMTPEVMENFVEEAQEDGVTYLRGYAGAVVEFAQYCKDHNLSLSPHSVSVVSNPIDQLQRRIIKEAFNCDVYDIYGSKECQNMAHECPHSENHLHVLSDLRHIDILNDNKMPVAGEEEGTVYVTSFTNYIMPLIRYSLGDRTHWITEPCKCGLPFPLIHRILGRESNVILDKNGYQIHAPSSHVYIEAESILGYQFVVHDKGVITIKLIPNKENPEYQKGIDNIKKYYTEQYAGRVDFDFEIVDSIPHDGGKLRFIVYDKPIN